MKAQDNMLIITTQNNTGLTMAQQREQFGSRIGFILAAASSAIGIGNLVAFPVKATQSGGAVFLLIYTAFVIFVCLPIMIAEMSLGRTSNRNPLGAYKAVSNNSFLWKIGGFLAVLTPFMIAVFYQVITVWLLAYFVGAVTGNLAAMTEANYFTSFVNSPSVFIYLVALTIIVGTILSLGVQNGIERLSRVIMPVLVLILLTLTAYILTLPNAMIGLKYYLVPDFSKVTASVVNNALNHAFFSLSLGMGILITYGSYLNRQQNVASNAKMVALFDTSIAFLAGLLILPAIFVFNPTTNPEELSTSSVSLVFTYLPKIFLYLQTSLGYVGASIFAAVFFLAVFFAALTSQVSILQVPISTLQDELGYSIKKSVLMCGAFAAALVLACTVSFGIVDFYTNFMSYADQNKSFFDVIADVFYDTILPLNGLIICLFVILRWKKMNMNNELRNGNENYNNTLTSKYINLSLTTFIPVILLFVFINTVCQRFFAYDLFQKLIELTLF